MIRGRLHALVGTALLVLAAARCTSFEEDRAESVGDGGADVAASDAAGADASADAASDAGCGDVSSDDRNCGACGHDCAGGACLAGACQPFRVTTGLTSPDQLALGPAWLYVEVTRAGTQRRDIAAFKRPIRRDAPVVLAVSEVFDVKSMAATDALLAFATHDGTSAANRLEACDAEPSACTASLRPLETETTNVFDHFVALRRGPDGLYWARLVTTDGEVRRLPTAGSAPETVTTTGCTPSTLGVGTADVAWGCGDGAVRRCALPCTQPGGSELSAGGGAAQMIRTAGALAWEATSGAIQVVGNDGKMRPVAGRGTGPFTMVGTDLVFFDSTTNELVTCVVPDCLVRKVVARGVSPARIVADAQAVYWTDVATGTVYGIAR